METILRSQEMAEISLIPIRHHSPACAWHVRQVIEKEKPDCILVEGPDNANSLIPIMVHEDTKAPFAVYYSCHDDQGKHKCYYPFLDYSPELEALREGTRRGIPVAFMDLPYGDILAASEAGKGLLKEDGKQNYNDDHLLSQNEYWKKLCEKTGLRSFDEFWEKYFEINGIRQDSARWFSQLLTYCTLARQNTRPEVLLEEGCLAREAYMAWQIQKKAKEAGKDRKVPYKILAVTGGFHTPGLKKLLEEESADAGAGVYEPQVPPQNQAVYLMPYSMEAADAMNGYASGMPFPGFYQKIWEGLTEEAGFGLTEANRPYEKAVLDLLVTAGKEARKKEGNLSTYDEICACSMASGLASLRDKTEPGAYELIDAVLSSFVKGEYNLSTETPMKILRRQMTGSSMGKLCQTASVPPIVYDYEEQCRKFGLKVRSTLESETILSIFSSPKHRSVSMFFHRMEFLGTGFAKRVKGPNLQLKRDRNLMRESWKYKWSTQVTAALIDVSVHGGTVEEAAISLVKEELKKDSGARESALLMTRVFEMGLEGQLKEVYDKVYERILGDTNFGSIGEALSSLMMMEELAGLYRSRLETGKLLHVCCQKLIALLPSMGAVKDEDLAGVMKVLRLLYQITGRTRQDMDTDSGAAVSEVSAAASDTTASDASKRQSPKLTDFTQERSTYYDALALMLEDRQLHPGLDGCIHGILYGSGRENMEQVEAACIGYLTGTREQLLKTASFFRGLFYTARDLVFIGSQFLNVLDRFLAQVEDAEFMELVPELRMAFGYFTPGEIDRIAAMAAGLHGKGRKEFEDRHEVLPGWYAYGKELDEYARRQIEGDGNG